MSTLRSFWKKVGPKTPEPIDPVSGKDRYDARRAELAAPLKSAGGSAPHKAALATRLKAAVDLAAAGKHDKAADALDPLEQTIIEANKAQADALSRRLEVQMEAIRTIFPAMPPDLGRREASVKAAVAAADFGKADDELNDLTQAALDAGRARKQFETNRTPLAAAILAADAKVASKRYGAPPPGALGTAVDDYEKARGDMGRAEKALDYAGAGVALGLVDVALKAIAANAPAYAHTLAEFRARKAAMASVDVDGKVDANAYGNPPLGSLGKAVDAYVAARVQARGAERRALRTNDFAAANAALDAMESAILAVRTAEAGAGDPKQAFDDRLPDLSARRQSLNLKVTTGIFGSPPPAPIKQASDEVMRLHGEATRAKYAGNYVGAMAALDAMEVAMAPLIAEEAKIAKGFMDKKDTQKGKVSRAELLAHAKKDPDILKTIAGQPGGREYLDAMVADLGDKLKDGDEKEFLQKALVARFGLQDLSGGPNDKGLSKKALPRLYKVLGMVPESHTADNPLLKQIVRQKKIFGTSSYADEGADRGKLELNLPRTSGPISLGIDLVTSALPSQKILTGKGKAVVSHFDQTTLHEIGHAVDDNLSFMRSQGGNPGYGGWKASSKDEVRTIMARDLKFHADWEAEGYPRSFTDAYLTKVLAGADPSGDVGLLKGWRDDKALSGRAGAVDRGALLTDPGVLDADAEFLANGVPASLPPLTMRAAALVAFPNGPSYDVAIAAIQKILKEGLAKEDAVDAILGDLALIANAPDEPDWKGLAKHPAIDWYKNIKIAGENGLWDRGDGGAQHYAVGGRVYQESYGDDWWSYSLSARGNKVSQYQWRSPAEWFAEVYAAFYLDKLPANHALHGWLTEQGPPK